MDAIYLIKIVHVVYTGMINRSRFTFIFLASRQIEEFTRFCLVPFILCEIALRKDVFLELLPICLFVYTSEEYLQISLKIIKRSSS